MKNKGNNLLKKNLVLAILVIAIAVLPLLFLKNAEFAGSDDKAKEAITQINSDYKPWFSPIWEPPSAEIESLLFSLQAAIGSGIICYYLGYLKGKSKRDEGKK
ncbi:energy-coupling factor ABC transporter substrate-binding protein [Clostridium sp.]|uniref:energy-coupling factor ABC transporter substrate-binding protein n=1 Tax=Clostridium sp. TaxID=1506 RepID=UPI002629C9CD|nr:energy-coupling factor ABC transporter substrate-binding protein [Clostridium sp.]